MSRLGRGNPIRAKYSRGVIGLHVADTATVGLLFGVSAVEVFTPSATGSYFFDGVDDHLTFPNDVSLRPTVITLAAWAKLASNPSSADRIISMSGNTAWLGWETSPAVRNPAGLINDGSNKTVSRDVATDTALWHHYAITYDPADGFARLYFDGVEVDTVAATGALNWGTGTIGSIGRFASSTGGFPECNIAFVGVWGTKLSATEIADLVGGGDVPQPDHLRAWWGLNESGDITDKSGHGMGLTNVGATFDTLSEPGIVYLGYAYPDAATAVAVLTPSGTEVYTPAIEYTDAATATLKLTASGVDVHAGPAAAFPTTLLLDNFKRAAGVGSGLSEIGAGWNRDTWALGEVAAIAHQITGYLRSDYASGPRIDIHFVWQGFGPDCEEYFEVTQFSNSTNWKFGGGARIYAAGGSGVDGYKWEIKKSDNTVNIYRVTDATPTLIATASHTASLGIYGFSCVDDLLTVYKDGAAILSVTDSVYAGTANTVVNLWADVGTSATQDFHFENFGAGTIGEGSADSPYSDLIMGDGPVAYWRLNENNSGIVRDFTNNGWTGYCYGTVADEAPGVVSGDPDNANEFSRGDSDYIRVPLSIRDYVYHPTYHPAAGITLETWQYRPVTISPTAKDEGLIGGWDGASGGGFMLWISFFTGGYGFTLDQTSSRYLDSSVAPTLGGWDHIVGTYEQTSPTTGIKCLYINGELVMTDVHSPTIVGAGTVFDLASYADSNTNTLGGWLDEAAVYDYALTEEQILAHYEMALYGAGGVDHTDSATVTLSFGAVNVFPYGQPILDNFNRADSASLGSNWLPIIPADNRWEIDDGQATFTGVGFVNDVWATEFESRDLFVWAEISQLGNNNAYIWIAQEVNTATADAYGFVINATAEANQVIQLSNNDDVDALADTTLTIPWAVGDLVGFSYSGSTLRAYRKPVGGNWYPVWNPIFTPSIHGGPFEATYIGIGEQPNSTPWGFTNFGGGSIPAVIELDTFHGVDASTGVLALTPSGVDEYTGVAGTEYIDSATASLAFTVSATEFRDRTDAATVPLSLTASAVEIRERSDSATVSLVFTVSAVEIRERSDSATVSLVLTVSATEFKDITDAATVTLTFTVSAAEIRERTNAATITLALTASSTELEDVIDSATASVVFTPSGVDDHVTGGVYTDSATLTLTLTASATELEGAVDAQTAVLTLTPSALEARTVTDAATVNLALSVTATEAQGAVDASTITVRVTGTAVEAKEAQDAATASLGLTPSAVVLFAGSDSALTTLVLSPSGVDDYTTGGVYLDSATARATFTVSATELAAGVDSATASITLTPSSTDTYGRVDAATASLLFTVSGVDTYTTASAYVDAATALLGLTIAAVEGRERQDTGIATLALTVTYASAYGTTDAATGQVTLTPSATFERATLSTATVPLAFTITSVELAAQTDAATLYLDLTPKTALVFDNPLLIGILSSSYAGNLRTRSYSATVSSRTFDTTITAPRFTGTVSTDMTGDIDSHFAGTIRR